MLEEMEEVFDTHVEMARDLETLLQKHRAIPNDFRLTQIGLATLLQMPTEILKSIISFVRGEQKPEAGLPTLAVTSVNDITMALISISATANHFLRRNIETKIKRGTSSAGLSEGNPAEQPPVASSSHPDQPVLEATSAVKGPESYGNVGERNKCLKRHGDRCIVTGSPFPEVCHIVPFSWTSSHDNQLETYSCVSQLRVFLSQSSFKDLLSDLAL